MIIIKVEKLSNSDESHTFGGVACDVEGCEAYEPQQDNERKNLLEHGWFVAPGRHRCPEHFDTDVPGRPQQRVCSTRITKRI